LKIQNKTVVETSDIKLVISALRSSFPIVPEFPFPRGTIIKFLDTEEMPPEIVGNLGIVQAIDSDEPGFADIGTFNEDGDPVSIYVSGKDVERVLVTV
jgi:hypothetical protein